MSFTYIKYWLARTHGFPYLNFQAQMDPSLINSKLKCKMKYVF